MDDEGWWETNSVMIVSDAVKFVYYMLMLMGDYLLWMLLPLLYSHWLLFSSSTFVHVCSVCVWFCMCRLTISFGWDARQGKKRQQQKQQWQQNPLPQPHRNQNKRDLSATSFIYICLHWFCVSYTHILSLTLALSIFNPQCKPNSIDHCVPFYLLLR